MALSPDQRRRLLRMNMLMSYAAFASAKATTAWTPATLFANAEPGVFFDFSDMSAMFQDAAGTTPVTAVEQPVGLVLDKSRGLVLGSELVTNGDLSSATGWSVAAGVTISGGVADFVAVTSSSALYRAAAVSIGKWYKVVVVVTARSAGSISPRLFGGLAAPLSITAPGTYTFYDTPTTVNTNIGFVANNFTGAIDSISVVEISGSHASQGTAASRPVLSARVNQFVSTATLATQNITTIATNYTLRFEGTGSITLSGTATGTYSSGTHTVTCTAGTLTATVSSTVTNADIRVANDGVGLPAYQRVDSGTAGSSTTAGTLTYDTTGFPMYLRFDGTDDSLSTGSIDFTSTDKMTVWAGVRKLSDAAYGTIAELSAQQDVNTGSFAVFAPNSAKYDIRVKGNSASNNYLAYMPEIYTAPISNIVTMLGNLAGSTTDAKLTPRVDGIVKRNNEYNTGAGTGNFGNYPLYIGRRGGSTLPANMRLYGLIVRGAASTDAQIASTEAWMNGKTKAYAA